jgi:hypothetical protein
VQVQCCENTIAAASVAAGTISNLNPTTIGEQWNIQDCVPYFATSGNDSAFGCRDSRNALSPFAFRLNSPAVFVVSSVENDLSAFVAQITGFGAALRRQAG